MTTALQIKIVLTNMSETHLSIMIPANQCIITINEQLQEEEVEEEEVLLAVDVLLLELETVQVEVEDIMIEAIDQRKLCMN